MDEETIPAAPGTLIGDRYRVEHLLGRGGMGAVFAGRHLELHERVAIKFLHKEHAAHADRFFREARAASRIRSEHVVRIFDVGRLPTGEPYIVMEYLEGGDLGERLEKSGVLDLASAADILIDVCQALAHAHALGIVHRDLKPPNIYLAREVSGDHCVKLLDFGVAKVPDAGSLTRTTTLLGSPVYMSPEQLMGARGVDARSDIWSLGIVLYELLTSVLPFEGDSIVHQGILVREKSTPPVTALRPELPAEIDQVIARCLGKEARDRYQDVAELAAALAPFASEANRASVPRIRRILSAVRDSKPDLASTLPLDEGSSPSLSSSRPSQKAQAATRISGVGHVFSPADSIPISPASDPVALASSRAQQITTVPDAHAERRQRTWVLAALAILATVVILFVARELLKSRSMDAHETTVAGSAAALTPSIAPAPSTEQPALAIPSAVASTDVTVGSAPSAAVSAQHSSRHSHTKPPAVAASAPAVAAPKPNCNPGFFMRDGIKVPKPECMQ